MSKQQDAACDSMDGKSMVILGSTFSCVYGETSISSDKEGWAFRNPTNSASRCESSAIDVSQYNFCKISFTVNDHEGNAGVFRFVKPDGGSAIDMPINSVAVLNLSDYEKLTPSILVMEQSSVCLDCLEISFFQSRQEYDEFLLAGFHESVLEITPSYPTENNRYLCGFVHSRLSSYARQGKSFDVAVVHKYQGCCRYVFEGIEVTRMSHAGLRKVLQTRQYNTIAVHFFDEHYANVFDACALSRTRLFLWAHGVETLYRDSPEFNTGYFKKKAAINEGKEKRYKKLDAIVKRYSEMENVTWVFVSDWIRKRSEELIGLKFERYVTIPNYIDSTCFSYEKKDSSLRKKVFFIRRFDDIAKYAIDVNVRAILALSRRKCFEDMEFHIFGTGTKHSMLVKPLRQFSNVHIHQEFLSHERIAQAHKECGIALFATRYDAQGVSMCEAAMSGLAVVSSRNEVCETFLPESEGLLAETEDYIEYADIIEALYKDEERFQRASKACHDKVARLCGEEQTTGKEIKLLFQEGPYEPRESTLVETEGENPVLTIAIPSYNASAYLRACVSSVVSQPMAKNLEVLIVNDGSTDDTLEVARSLAELYNSASGRPLIRVIDKENGGHGSGINVGIAEARGKYFRILDADDRMVSEELGKLIAVLAHEESDIVLTDYAEDRYVTNTVSKKELYTFMAEGQPYYFDDLCYPGYGFRTWGPLLATGSFKTSMLKETNFKLTEKCFYVDMEFDMYSVVKAETVVYYPFDIYRYAIGDEGQSISRTSFIRNMKQHERVIFNMLAYVKAQEGMSELKRSYIIDKLVSPMIKVQYRILIEWLANREGFLEFDEKLKQYDSVYRSKKAGGSGRIIAFHRRTEGRFLSANDKLIWVKEATKKLKKHR